MFGNPNKMKKGYGAKMKDVLSTIPVIIFAGGLGTRMQPYSSVLPKPLLLYNGKTMIENIISLYVDKGFHDFYIILGHNSELIKSYLESKSLPCNVVFVSEREPLGTIGGLKLIENELDNSFIVCNCDNYGDFDYISLIEYFDSSKADILIPIRSIVHTIPFGIINCDSNMNVCGINEKPQTKIMISTGIHILKRNVLDLISKGERIDMPQLINRASNSYVVKCVDVSSYKWIDMSISE